MASAFEQIKQYERDIPRLFAANAFNIVTDGIGTLYGATGATAQFYAPWPDAWPRRRQEFTDDISKDLWCLLEPSRLLDTLAHFRRSRRSAAINNSVPSTRRFAELPMAS
jgi:type I restriction enzyme R subunit